MASAGKTGYFNPPKPQGMPTSQFGNPGSFTGAANQQASDYDKIMGQYDDFIKNVSSNPQGNYTPIAPSASVTPQQSNFNSIAPQTSQYNQSGDVTKSLAGLSDLATTGGYSDADKQDIRARDISPIRSIYANAQQNAERGKALAGGYSPNFNAVTAQMSRDEANKIGDITTSANAGIAQNVAANRLSATPAYAAASEKANAAQTEADRHNADIINQINQYNSAGAAQNNQFNANAVNDVNKFNTAGQQRVNELNASNKLNTGQTTQGNILGAIQGKTNLYGTTPALTNTFGNQVIQAGQLGQGQQQLNNQKLNVVGGMSSSFSH